MIYRFETIESTNTYAKELAQQGAPHGTVVVAQTQTGGRGRMGRSFFSPPGTGLYLSMILRPPYNPSQLMHLTCATAVAACNAISLVCGMRPKIKWANDLVWNGKKLGGILTEPGFLGDKLRYIVVGIGVNCNQKQQDFPPELQSMATSLSAATGQAVDMQRLETSLIDQMLETSESLVSKQNQIMDQYRYDCITTGQDICVITGENTRHAKAMAVENDGSLRILHPDRTEELVTTGEVTIRGMYGYL